MAATAAGIEARVRNVPWQVWCSVTAVTCAVLGTHWDISWHRTIGRDSFWTPAHICIHLCGILAGVASAALILRTTLDRGAPLRETSVKIWGFRGPLGAFILAWGGIAMITSAPFDDWWHNAYGLDVKILSPPHMVLAAGILAVQFGTLILILGGMNRARGESRERFERLFLYTGGMQLVLLMILEMEIAFRSAMHQAHFYRVVATAVPVVLAGIARASDHRWSATILCAIYMTVVAGFVWILPLFPGEPELGPVYNPVTSFVPPEFPLLLVAPAFALDLLWQRTANWRPWRLSFVSGLVFLAVFAAVQWPFADFLMSPAARNWFFGTHYFSYDARPGSAYVEYRFFAAESGARLLRECGLAIALAVVTTRLGLGWGNWMRRIRR